MRIVQNLKFKMQNYNLKLKIFNFKLQLLIFNFALLIFILTLTPTFAQTTNCTTTIPRAEGLVTSPQQSATAKFGTTSGACVTEPRAGFAPFKVPSYDDLKSIYFDQSKATKITTLSSISASTAFSGSSLYYVNGDLTVSGTPTGSGTQVVFVNGKLNITSDYTYGTALTGTVFIVKGDVNISYSPTLVTRVDAVIVSSGVICTAYDGVSCPGANVTTSPLTINGSLVSLNDAAPIKFRRSLTDNSCPNCAAEKVNNQVKYLVALKDLFSTTLQKWSEVTGPYILATPQPTSTPTPTYARVFVTSTTYDGNLGGLAGADAKCQSSAASLGGTWKAWLSDTTTSAASRLVHSSIPYKSVNGSVTFANDWNDLITSKSGNYLAAPINVNELGQAVPATLPWTNTNPNGTANNSLNPISDFNCSDWTAGLDYIQGWYGNTTSRDAYWTNYGSDMCNMGRRLYCFEQLPAYALPPPNPLVAYYPMDETSGTIVADSSGNNLTGTSTSATNIVQPGRIGAAYRTFFDGTDKHIDIGNPPSLQFGSGSSFTISAWIKPNTFSGSHTIVSHGTNPNPSLAAFNFYVADGGYLEFSKPQVANTGQSTATTPVALNQWQHVAVVNNIGTNVKFYINGVLKSTAPFSQTYNYLKNLMIGESDSEGFNFVGGIDDVKIYNRALTDTEIQTLYTSAPPQQTVQFDAKSVAPAGSGSSITWQHCTGGTCPGGNSGNNRIMIVGVSTENYMPVSSITYNGKSFISPNGGLIGSTALGTARGVQLWYLLNPDPGTHDIVVTFPGSQASIVAGATTWTGVSQTKPTGYLGNAASDDNNYLVNIPSAPGQVVVDDIAVHCGSGLTPKTAGQIQQWSLAGPANWGGGSSQPGASTVTMAWTDCGIQDYVIGAVPLSP